MVRAVMIKLTRRTRKGLERKGLEGEGFGRDGFKGLIIVLADLRNI